MGIEKYLLRQQELYPLSTPQDILKHCYQAAFGAEHLLSDLDAAEKWFNEEYSALEPTPGVLFQELSADVCRVDMAAWKAKGLPESWLFRLFCLTAQVQKDGKELFQRYTACARSLCADGCFSFGLSEFEAYLEEHRKAGSPPLRHSEKYRSAYSPAYRIVSSRLVRLLPILQKATEIKKRPCIIAIDGRAASGKSSMAEALSYVLGCDAVHMDDFFLPTELRTAQRYAEPGGNIHYERFMEEVLPHLSSKGAFSYRVFDCGTLDYSMARCVNVGDFVIVEGSYSLHPKFSYYAHIPVFSHVEPGEQMRRIINRDGEDYAKVFRSRWIPLEEAYFAEYPIKNAITV